MEFQNRKEAGIKLGDILKGMHYKNPIVFGIPRGGVETASEISKILKAPLDIIPVRKLGMPFDPEFGFGAIAPGNTKVIDHDLLTRFNVSEEDVQRVIESEVNELNRRILKYKFIESKRINLSNNTSIIVDDGIATGMTIFAAIKYHKTKKPGKIVVAAPVCAKDTAAKIEKKSNENVFLTKPQEFFSVGQFYRDFPQLSDIDVIQLLSHEK